MAKFKFKSKRKNKFNFISNNDEILNSEIIAETHTEIFANKKIIIEGCRKIIDYQSEYLKLKLKKGVIIIVGTDFLITDFDMEKIIIKGNIISIEFCV